MCARPGVPAVRVGVPGGAAVTAHDHLRFTRSAGQSLVLPSWHSWRLLALSWTPSPGGPVRRNRLARRADRAALRVAGSVGCSTGGAAVTAHDHLWFTRSAGQFLVLPFGAPGGRRQSPGLPRQEARFGGADWRGLRTSQRSGLMEAVGPLGFGGGRCSRPTSPSRYPECWPRSHFGASGCFNLQGSSWPVVDWGGVGVFLGTAGAASNAPRCI